MCPIKYWFISIVASYVPRMPYRPWLRAILDFADETTRPYINFFRRFLRPVGGAGFMIDLSPTLAIILLFVAWRVVVALIEG